MFYVNRFPLLPLVLFSLAACTAPSVTDDSAGDVEAPVNRFLAFYFDEYRRGLPEQSQLSELALFVTPELLDLFEAALRGQECDAKRSIYEGPSGVHGDLFSSLFEGGTSATYRLIDQQANNATFEIEWTNYTEWLSPDAFVWQDRVFVVKTTDGWRISDFTHDGDWEFMMHGSVSQILRAVADECAE